MRLGRRRENRDDAQIDMTSMLDIVFIMLIFLLLLALLYESRELR